MDQLIPFPGSGEVWSWRSSSYLGVENSSSWVGIRLLPSSQDPKSTIRQRSLQNGRHRFLLSTLTGLPQFGQRAIIGCNSVTQS